MKNTFITSRKEDHTYWGNDGRQYMAVSHLLKKYCKEFDPKKMAPLTAKKRDRISKETAAKLKISQLDVLLTYPINQRGITTEEVLKEWDCVRDSAVGRGNNLHNALEHFALTGKILSGAEEMGDIIRSANALFKDYSKVFPEHTFHSKKYGIAGTSDMPCARTSSASSIIDIGDYKTNESRGIEYHNKYGDFFFDPISHLEDCSYNKYSLQMSLYGVMAQEEFGCKIGKLFLVYIPAGSNTVEKIPVPYLKHEALAILEDNLSRQVSSKSIVVTEDVEFFPEFD